MHEFHARKKSVGKRETYILRKRRKRRATMHFITSNFRMFAERAEAAIKES